jgi:hypothetical protein
VVWGCDEERKGKKRKPVFGGVGILFNIVVHHLSPPIFLLAMFFILIVSNLYDILLNVRAFPQSLFDVFLLPLPPHLSHHPI